MVGQVQQRHHGSSHLQAKQAGSQLQQDDGEVMGKA